MNLSRPVGTRPGASPTAFLGDLDDPVHTGSSGGLSPVPFGTGKAAMAQFLRSLDPPADANVLLPAAIPHRFPEAIRAGGATPRYYRVDDALEPVVDDVRERVDDDTIALVVVQYFGFPQPRFDALREVADDEGLLLVDDSSHGALSERDGQPFGSFGDVGFTSLHKLLPVPDGALLYPGDRQVLPPDPPESYGRETCRYLVAAGARRLAESTVARRVRPPGTTTLAAFLQTGATLLDSGTPGGWDVPMSRLTRASLARFDRDSVVAARRARYREWLDILDDVEGVGLVFESLPSGVCPWVCPVVCSDPMRFLRTTVERVGGTFRWPTLPDGVDSRSYPVATRLSRTLLALPVHQGLRPGLLSALVSDDANARNR